ncbi:hypothetical protein CYMTET_32277 [Cymbomonas tetramitiformis]|uniref:Uncharacterized protein n=1 Tax=Cymbomonas tetramitiformis TaxID=36881 RepID=A0AAE0FF62_9CHLO|nr:hypothetical protein CYMTET_32277 [Cymbomonas tetramitiformis]
MGRADGQCWRLLPRPLIREGDGEAAGEQEGLPRGGREPWRPRVGDELMPPLCAPRGVSFPSLGMGSLGLQPGSTFRSPRMLKPSVSGSIQARLSTRVWGYSARVPGVSQAPQGMQATMWKGRAG